MKLLVFLVLLSKSWGLPTESKHIREERGVFPGSAPGNSINSPPVYISTQFTPPHRQPSQQNQFQPSQFQPNNQQQQNQYQAPNQQQQNQYQAPNQQQQQNQYQPPSQQQPQRQQNRYQAPNQQQQNQFQAPNQQQQQQQNRYQAPNQQQQNQYQAPNQQQQQQQNQYQAPGGNFNNRDVTIQPSISQTYTDDSTFDFANIPLNRFPELLSNGVLNQQQDQQYAAPQNQQQSSRQNQQYFVPQQNQGQQQQNQGYSAPQQQQQQQSYSAPQNNQDSPVFYSSEQQQSNQQQEGYTTVQTEAKDGKITKHFYVHLPPPETTTPPPTYAPPPGPQKHYKIVFIKAPHRDPHVVIPPTTPKPQQKTLIYVLSEKVKHKEIQLPEQPATPPTKPEVYFISYSKDGQRVQQEAYQAPGQAPGQGGPAPGPFPVEPDTPIGGYAPPQNDVYNAPGPVATTPATIFNNGGAQGFIQTTLRPAVSVYGTPEPTPISYAAPPSNPVPSYGAFQPMIPQRTSPVNNNLGYDSFK